MNKKRDKSNTMIVSSQDRQPFENNAQTDTAKLIEESRELLALRTDNKKLKQIVQQQNIRLQKIEKTPRYDESQKLKKLSQILTFIPELRRKMVIEQHNIQVDESISHYLTISETLNKENQDLQNQIYNLNATINVLNENNNKLTHENLTMRSKIDGLQNANNQGMLIKNLETTNTGLSGKLHDDIKKLEAKYVRKEDYDKLKILLQECLIRLKELQDMLALRKNEIGLLQSKIPNISRIEDLLLRRESDIKKMEDKLNAFILKVNELLKIKKRDLLEAIDELDKHPSLKSAGKAIDMLRIVNSGISNGALEKKCLLLELESKDWLNQEKDLKANLFLVAKLCFDSLRVKQLYRKCLM